MADRTDPTGAIPFGISPQTLFSKRTVRTIHLGGDVDGPLCKRILSRVLHSTTGWLLLDSAAFRLLARRKYRLRTALQPVQMPLPAATVHTPEAGFPLAREREELPWQVPIRSRVSCPLASSFPVRVAGSTPIDRPLATVPAHTLCRSTSGRDLLPDLRQQARPAISSPPMVEIKHLLDQEPIDGQCCDEEFVDPFTDTLPH